MKLASLKHGRDGKLVVVSKDITRYSSAEHIAPTMQYALDNWAEVAPQLEALYRDVEHWTVPGFAAYVAQLEVAADAADPAAEDVFLEVAAAEAAFWQTALTA